MRTLLYTAALLVTASACGGGNGDPAGPGGGGPPPAGTVEVRNNSFSPQTITIAPGEAVTWSWVGQGHNVTAVLAPTFAPNSAIQSAPASHGPITFSTAGTYQYICTVHGAVVNGVPTGMAGTVVVQ